MTAIESKRTAKQLITVRWGLPRHILDGLKASHLVNGLRDESMQDFVARMLLESTPAQFRVSEREERSL